MTFAVATLVFEVQIGGSDSNGGGFDPGVTSPGTDYSQQASAQVAFTDLVIGSAGNENQLTSAAHPFSSASPGNCINITGGTGFTTGLYRILSVSGSTATMDRPVGTASSTGGTGNLGGAWATISKAITNTTVSGQVTYVKSGTYQTAVALASPGAASGTSLSRIIGYASTRGDNGQPTIQITASNVTLMTGFSNDTSGLSLENFIFDGNNQASSNGFYVSPTETTFLTFINCVFKQFTGQYCIQSLGISGIDVQSCEFASNAFTTNRSGCILGSAGGTVGIGGEATVNVCNSYFNGNSINSTNLAAAIWGSNLQLGVRNCVFYNNSGTNMDGVYLRAARVANISTNAFHANGRHGVNIDSDQSTTPAYSVPNVQNNIFTNNGGYGISGSFSTTPTILIVNHNAYYNNTSGDKTGFTAGAGEVTLTGLPYVNAPTDFSLNSSAGQGGACRAAGTPGTIGVSSVVGTGHLDIGPLQHGDPASGYAYASVA